MMDDLNSIGGALAVSPTLSLSNERNSRLNSCQSPDQFFIKMVNEFLNDDTTLTMDDVVKTTPLNIEYLEEPSDAAVENLLDFRHLKSPPITLAASTTATTSTSVSATTTPSSTPRTNSPTSSYASTTTATIDETRSVNPLLISNLCDNLPSNVKEISYQRFGRFNTNLPAEVHNFKCHMCAFSCAWKEILLQHFQEKHPT